jgi:hypothetical protein
MSSAPQSQGLSLSTKKPRSIGAAIALFFTAPLAAEFLLGNLPITFLGALVVLAPLYGGGALLIRETVRRTGRGWPSIFVLGMAYAILEEAITTQSLFNPDYLHLHLGLLQPAYIPALGIGAWWTLWMLNVHPVWSIAVSIALIEATVPDRAATPWLGRIGYTLTCVVFAIGVAGSTLIGYRQDHFLASTAQLVSSIAVIVILTAGAFLLPRTFARREAGWAPNPWIAGVLALAAGSAALLTPKSWGWGAVAVLLALDLSMFFAVLIWSRRNWTLLHKLALAAGAALAYAWHAFIETPAVGKVDPSLRAGNAIFALAAIGLIWLGARRTAYPPTLIEISVNELQSCDSAVATHKDSKN